MEGSSFALPTRLLDQRLARALVRPLVGTRVHPNALTTLTLALGVAAAACFCQGTTPLCNLGAVLFMLAVFSDHLDGELARAAGKTSRFGYFYDFLVGGVNYTLLFAAIGIGLEPVYGTAALVLGFAAAVCNPVIMTLRLRLDLTHGLEATEHHDFGWFNLEDIVYLIGPITWLAGVEYFFIVYGFGTLGYLCWTLLEYRRWSGF
jgi:archaetidylinositol phosphate synthase